MKIDQQLELYDKITKQFQDKPIKDELQRLTQTITDEEFKDYRVINDFIAYLLNDFNREFNLFPGYTFKTTRYNEKIYIKHNLDELYSFSPLNFSNNDFSYKFKVDLYNQFSYEDVLEDKETLESLLISYMLTVFEELN
jgi:hypothetical protein